MTTFDALLLIAFVLALFPALQYLANLSQFRPPPAPSAEPVAVSLLIPARNEELSIAASVGAALESVGVELELIVLDDGSTDATAEIVAFAAAKDSRVRLVRGTPLPPGWCGKQHACYTLAGLATHGLLAFLDADVRLAPDALARLAAFQRVTQADLVSGFPRQETVTLGERLVVPLIQWLLMNYLPMRMMRASNQPGLGVGCGQWFLTTRAAYDKVGGHAAVKSSLHDGVKLPRAYRKAGLRTDICDASSLATCRMYRSTREVWLGFAKNAREGMGGPVGIWVWTTLLLGGHVLPYVLLVVETWNWHPDATTITPRDGLPIDWRFWQVVGVVVLSAAPAFHAAKRFNQASPVGPVGIMAMVAIQWYAAARSWLGRPVGWKSRPHPSLGQPLSAESP